MVSLKEVVNGGTLFEEVHEQTGVAEDSKNINEIKNLEKNEPSLQIQLKLLQEQINELKSVEKSKTKTQEYITEEPNKNPVSNVVDLAHIAMVNAQQKGKFVQNAENQIILLKFVSLLILMLLIMKMIILSNTLIIVIFQAL